MKREAHSQTNEREENKVKKLEIKQKNNKRNNSNCSCGYDNSINHFSNSKY